MRILIFFVMIAHPTIADPTRVFLDPKPPSRAVRREIAQQELQCVRALDAVIPALSPSQAEWYRKEIQAEMERADGRFTERSLAAADTVEYDIAVTKHRVHDLAETLQRLASEAPLSERAEVALWTTVVLHLSSRECWQGVASYARRRSLDLKKLGYTGEFFVEDRMLYAHFIVDKVLVPYFAGALPK